MPVIDKMLDAIDRCTPKDGFNLVGVDDFEEPGEELYFIEHFNTRPEAQADLDKRLAADPKLTLYIYGKDE